VGTHLELGSGPCQTPSPQDIGVEDHYRRTNAVNRTLPQGAQSSYKEVEVHESGYAFFNNEFVSDLHHHFGSGVSRVISEEVLAKEVFRDHRCEDVEASSFGNLEVHMSKWFQTRPELR
jgi:hypothetical protein